VLVALFEEDGEARVILTRRAEHLRNHRGEVSFPGGRLEPEESPVEGALREATEEIDLDPALVEIIGELAPLSTMSSTSAITPFVGVLAQRPALEPNPDEVDHVFDVALTDLLADDVFEEEIWTSPERGRRSVYFFHLPDDTVWGATARVLLELLELVALSPSSP
jgi:8-oxo-dGTP pyrophosphatase MutT (NUDIX family)